MNILSDKRLLKYKIINLLRKRCFLIEKYDLLLYLYLKDFCSKNPTLGLEIKNLNFLLGVYLKFSIFMDYLRYWQKQTTLIFKRSYLLYFLEFLGFLEFDLEEWELVLKLTIFFKHINVLKHFKDFLVIFEVALDCFYHPKFAVQDRNYILRILLKKLNLVFDYRFMNLFLYNLDNNKYRSLARLSRKKEKVITFFFFWQNFTNIFFESKENKLIETHLVFVNRSDYYLFYYFFSFFLYLGRFFFFFKKSFINIWIKNLQKTLLKKPRLQSHYSSNFFFFNEVINFNIFDSFFLKRKKMIPKSHKWILNLQQKNSKRKLKEFHKFIVVKIFETRTYHTRRSKRFLNKVLNILKFKRIRLV